jgi:hypothetical protein
MSEEFPRDIPDVRAGLEELSRREALLRIDGLLDRRPPDRKARRAMVELLRRDRLAWGNARDAREEKKELGNDN